MGRGNLRRDTGDRPCDLFERTGVRSIAGLLSIQTVVVMVDGKKIACLFVLRVCSMSVLCLFAGEAEH